MSQRPCKCEGSNDNCRFCFGTGFVESKELSPNPAPSSVVLSADSDAAFERLRKAGLISFIPSTSEPPPIAGKLPPKNKPFKRHVPPAKSLAVPPPLETRAKSDVPTVAFRRTTTCLKCGRLLDSDLLRIRHPLQCSAKPKNPGGALKSAADGGKFEFKPIRPSSKKRNSMNAFVVCPECKVDVLAKNVRRHLARVHGDNSKKERYLGVGSVGMRGIGGTSGSKKPSSAVPVSTKPGKILPSGYSKQDEFEQAQGVDRRDRTRGMGYVVRENGRYGSHPMHDGFDDEAGPE